MKLLQKGWYWYHCGSPIYEWEVVEVDQSDKYNPDNELWSRAYAEGRLIGPIKPPKEDEAYKAFSKVLKRRLEEHCEWLKQAKTITKLFALLLVLLLPTVAHPQQRKVTDSPSITWDYDTPGEIKAHVVESVATFFEARYIKRSSDCTTPVEVTIDGGPKLYVFTCADLNTSIFYGDTWLPVAITTASLTLLVNHGTTESITFAGDFSAMCRAPGTTVNSNWGTAVAANASITTANRPVNATAVVTPNGTCSAGSRFYWRYVVAAGSFSTNAANTRIEGVAFEGQ